MHHKRTVLCCQKGARTAAFENDDQEGFPNGSTAARVHERAMLKGKGAIVTGSTSGIGVGIAHALAGQGADIRLNDFGDADAIDKQRGDLTAEFNVNVAFSGADRSRPPEVRDMVAQATPSLVAST
jgi:hypothetical protein